MNLRHRTFVVDMTRFAGCCSPSPIADADQCLMDSLDIQFWTNLYSVEITSSECLSEVQSLLGCPSKIAHARSFRGREAQMFVDFLDQVSLSFLP